VEFYVKTTPAAAANGATALQTYGTSASFTSTLKAEAKAQGVSSAVAGFTFTRTSFYVNPAATCDSLRKACTSLRKACASLRKACDSLRKACTSLRKAEASLKKACTSLRKSCTSLNLKPKPTPTPTPEKKSIHIVKATLKFAGISPAAFNPSTPEGQKLRAFKNSVALGLKICGTSGTSQCSGTDVVITGVTRRRGDATVSFYVKTASKTAASSGATALSNYVSQGTTFVDNLKKEAAAQGVTAAVANVQTPVFTVEPKADTQSAPTPTPTVSGAGKTAVAAGVTVALAGLSMLW